MKTSEKINVLIVDKSDIVRMEIFSEFADHPSINICDVIQDYKKAVKFARKNKVDVMIIDADEDEIECFNTVKTITDKKHVAAAILWSYHPDEMTVDRARRAGASACIPKDGNWTQLSSIIQAVARGNCYFWISQNSPKPEHVSCP